MLWAPVNEACYCQCHNDMLQPKQSEWESQNRRLVEAHKVSRRSVPQHWSLESLVPSGRHPKGCSIDRASILEVNLTWAIQLVVAQRTEHGCQDE
jgi:hypothetical protein